MIIDCGCSLGVCKRCLTVQGKITQAYSDGYVLGLEQDERDVEEDWSQCNPCFDGDHDECVDPSCECDKHTDNHSDKKCICNPFKYPIAECPAHGFEVKGSSDKGVEEVVDGMIVDINLGYGGEQLKSLLKQALLSYGKAQYKRGKEEQIEKCHQHQEELADRLAIQIVHKGTYQERFEMLKQALQAQRKRERARLHEIYKSKGCVGLVEELEQ